MASSIHSGRYGGLANTLLSHKCNGPTSDSYCTGMQCHQSSLVKQRPQRRAKDYEAKHAVIYPSGRVNKDLAPSLD
jgi:hypothetical protein